MSKSNIRILMVLDDFDIGGTETYVLAVTKELMNHGVSVFLAGKKNGSLRKNFTDLGCQVFTDVRNMTKFRRWIKKNKINIINAHHGTSGKNASKLSRLLRIPFVYTIHGKYYNISQLREISQAKSTVISVSPPIQKWLNTNNISSLLIPNGIDTQEYRYLHKAELRKTLGIPDNAPIVLYASRLESKKVKICKLLVKATIEDLLKEFPSMHLIVAGDGKNANDVKKLVKKSQLSRIHLLGHRLDMPNLYSISNCVVGTGRVALEAMACNRTVIAVGISGMFGIVKPSNYTSAWHQYFGDHKSDEPYTQASITTTVRMALLSSKHHRYWGKQGRNFVKQKFEVSKVVRQLLKVYQVLVT